MTDKEIIKALECCGNVITSSCKECSYHSTYNANCVRELMRNALDLINRQQAEIKWWKDNCSKCGEKTTQTILYLQETLAEKDAEIERLTINMNAFGLGMKQEKERADTIKSEAIKEFARALRQQAFDRLYVSIDEIDNLVKEMAGEQE